MKKVLQLVNISEIACFYEKEGGYQRPLNEQRAKDIAKNWDPLRFTPPHLNFRNGRLFVVDGNHTVSAARLRGDATISAYVFEPPLTKSQEALYFDWLNSSRSPVRLYNTFMARVRGGETCACAVSDRLDALGLKLCPTGMKAHQEGMIGCIVALEKVYQEYGPEHLTQTLVVLREMFGNRFSTYKGHFVLGVARFLGAFPDVDVQRLIRRTRSEYQSAQEFEQGVKQMRKAFSEKVDSATSKLLISIFNKQLTAASRLDDAVLSKHVRSGSGLRAWITRRENEKLEGP